MKMLLFHVFITGLCVSVVNCSATTQPIVTGPQPTRERGCATFKGEAWFSCVRALHQRWETIESAQGVVEMISEDRDGDYIRRRKKICWSPYFCREFVEVTYSPSFWERTKRVGLIVIFSLLSGIVIGMTL